MALILEDSAKVTPVIKATHPVHCCRAWAPAPIINLCKRDRVVKRRLYSRTPILKVTSFTPYRSLAASRSTNRSACKARNSYCTMGSSGSRLRRLARPIRHSSSRPACQLAIEPNQKRLTPKHKPSRREGQEPGTGTKYDSGNELEG